MAPATASPAPAEAKNQKPARSSSRLWGRMPARMKVLYVTTLHRTGGWLTEAFATDSATEIHLEEAVGVTAGLAKLRDEVFDAVLISHEPGVLDAVEMIEGLRAGGNEEPMIVLGSQPAAEMDAQCYEVGADGYCCVSLTTTRTLLWVFAQSIERSQLIRENRRLVQAERQRLAHEHLEAERLLDEQRALISDLETICDGESAKEPDEPVEKQFVEASAKPESTTSTLLNDQNLKRTICQLPDALVTHYREMLRAYVIMGAGNLADEMSSLAVLLAEAGVCAQQTMQLHVHVLEELIGGLGSRSARHVMNRADLLVVEIMAHLADDYRERYHRRKFPPQQLMLPGFDNRPEPAFLIKSAA